MKRFDFPLERVRRWRQEQASLEELKLGQLRSEMADLEVAQQQLLSERSQCEQQLLSQTYVDPQQLETLDSYRISMRGKISGLENRQREWQVKVAEQFDRVIEARRKFKLLDCLRENAVSEWQAAANKEQEELAAELFLAKSRRRR